MNQYVVSAIAAIMAFAAGAVLYKIFIPILRKVKLGAVILEVGPNWHKNKNGTPIMGGLIFIIAAAAAFFTSFFVLRKGELTARIIINSCMLLVNAAIGFIDDYVKLFKKRNKGLSAGQKLILQVLAASAYVASLAHFCGINTALTFPSFEIELGIFYYPAAIVVMTYMINCANLTDGIDGLSGSVAVVMSVAFLAVSGFSSALGLFECALIGALAAFLVFNFHPAKIFMGDCGSLFLGTALVVAVSELGMNWLIITAGFIYVIEGLSVIIQVLSYKLTGKRVFKMAPIHHHFEKCGWSEVKIVGVFSLVTALFCALTYWLY